GEGGTDLGGAFRVVGLQVVERLVGQHDAPPEGVVGPVALDHAYPVRRIAPFHRDREIEAGRPAADADDIHGHRRSSAAPQDISSLKYPEEAALASALFLAGTRPACEARAGLGSFGD